MATDLVIRVAANLSELRSNLAEGVAQIETTKASIVAMSNAYDGARIISQANATVVAIQQMGGATALTADELRKANTVLDAALEKYKALGKDAPPGMKALADATRQVEPPTSLLTGAVGKLAGAFTLATAVKFGADLFAAAGHLQDLTEKTQISVEELQRLSVIAEQSGTNIDSVAQSVFQMGKRIAGGDDSAVAALKSLGLNFRDIRNMRPEDAFQIIGTALAALEDPMRRDALGAAIFGKSVADMLPVFQHLTDQVKPFVTLNEDQVKALDDLGDAYVRFKATIVPATVSWIDWYFNLSGGLKAIKELRGEIDALPKPMGDAKQLADDNAAAWKRMSESADTLANKLGGDAGSKGSLVHAFQTLSSAGKELDEDLAKQRAAAEKFAEAMTELNSVGIGWAGTLRTIDGDVVESIKYYLQANVAQDKLATAFGVTAAQVKSVASALADEQKQAKLTADIFAQLTALDGEYTRLTVQRSGTARDAKIADIRKWAESLEASLNAEGKLTSTVYNQIERISAEKTAQAGLDMQTLSTKSQGYLNEQLEVARNTYNEMIAHAANFSRSAIEEQQKVVDAAAAAARGWAYPWEQAADSVSAKVQSAVKGANALKSAASGGGSDNKLERDASGAPTAAQLDKLGLPIGTLVDPSKLAGKSDAEIKAIVTQQQQLRDAGGSFDLPTVDVSTPEKLAAAKAELAMIQQDFATNPGRAPNGNGPTGLGARDEIGYVAMLNERVRFASLTASLQGRAAGGPVSANTPYFVGERGPELFVPDRPGGIVPNGGGGVVVNVGGIHISGTVLGNKQEIARVVGEAIMSKLRGQGFRPPSGA